MSDEAARLQLARECQRWSDEFARRHKINVVERDASGMVACANWRTRTVTVPRLSLALSETVLLGRLAVRKHEFAHILQGACPGRAPHYRDPAVREWHNCVACEVDAWERALTLDGPFSRVLHDRLKRSLATYRQSTPAPAAALQASRRIATDQYYAERMLARAERDRRLDMQREIEEIAAEAARPRPLTELERKIADINRWAREVER